MDTISGPDANRLRRQALACWEQHGFLWGVRYDPTAVRRWQLEQVRSNGIFFRVLSFPSRDDLVTHLQQCKLNVPKGWAQKREEG